MITITMLRESGRLVGFLASGHAEYAPDGSDIVCSAVSALTQCIILGLQERLQLPIGVSIDEDEGVHCILGKECTEAQWKDAEILLDTLLLGLRSIETAYGENLNILEREV